jgi:hypothetical protein
MGRQVTRPALGDRGVRGRGRRWWFAAAVTTCVALAGGAGVVGADDAFRCELIESGGVAESDARTAADLVCQELRRASAGRGAFEVQLASLGRIVFVTASRIEPTATVTVRVDTVEEIPVAAPRLAEALVRGEPLVATQRVDNLLGAEARPLVSRKGSLKFLVGVADVESPGHGARAAGLTVGILYAAPRFALPAELRLAWDDAAYPDPELGLFSVSVGGRGYLSTRNTTPFAGGGIGVLRLHAREGAYPGSPDASSSYFDGERFGVAPYVEAGVETLRLHRARVALLVRVDLPLQSLETPEIPTYSYPDGWDREPVVSSVFAAQSRYVVPVSIGVSVAF